MRVLVIDDEPDLQSVVARALRLDGHVLATAPDLATARARVLDGTDLIVLDLRLPDGFGLDLCRALRAEGSTVPILVVTALTQVATRVAGFDAPVVERPGGAGLRHVAADRGELELRELAELERQRRFRR